jgi:transcriptional regulator with XRE-family HTH domain
VRLRRLASELKKAREASGQSQYELADATEMDRSTVSRLESGRYKPQKRTLAAYLDGCKVADPKRSELIELAKDADNPGWQRPYQSDLRDEYSTFIAFERESRKVRNYQSLFIPGLLQTEDYARHVIRGVWPAASTNDVEQHVKVRLERQALLTSADPLQLHVIMDEAALWRRVGGPGVMAEQMQRLQTMAALPHISVQVIPYSVGAHPGMPGSFALLSFADPSDPEIVYIDGVAGDAFLEAEDEVRQSTDRFDTLRTVGLSPNDSLSLIASVEHELRREKETAA